MSSPANKATPIARTAQRLQTQFGQRLVAYACNTRSPKEVGRWAKGETIPTYQQARRLQVLDGVARTLVTNGVGTTRAFLEGANPDLGDKPPVAVIREGGFAAVINSTIRFYHGQGGA